MTKGVAFKIFLSFITVLIFSSFYLTEDDNCYFIHLRGKKQYVLVEGEGRPSIIFLSGKGRPQSDFKKVYTKFKKTNLCFSYDRAGIGKSEAIRNERTIDTMAFELHELLVKAKIKPPYVLVGHSFGGSIARCFNNMYPQQVSGLVLVEPACEYEYQYGLSIRSDSDKVVFKDDLHSYLKVKGRTKGQSAESKHQFDLDSLGFSTNQRILKNLPTPKSIPVTVLISLSPDVENNYIEREIKYKVDYFEKWKTVNPQAKIIQTTKSGYFIQKDEPSLLIDEIKEVVSKSK